MYWATQIKQLDITTEGSSRFFGTAFFIEVSINEN
jgi:hypothetical protein